MSTRKAQRTTEDQFRGLLADLELLGDLQKMRVDLAKLDDTCAFLEEVYGRNNKDYRKAHVARDQLLLTADKRVQQWLKERRAPTPYSA